MCRLEATPSTVRSPVTALRRILRPARAIPGELERRARSAAADHAAFKGRHGRTGNSPLGSRAVLAKEETLGYKCINARAETAATAPAFRDPYRPQAPVPCARLRFHEWQKTPARGRSLLHHQRRRNAARVCWAVGRAAFERDPLQRAGRYLSRPASSAPRCATSSLSLGEQK